MATMKAINWSQETFTPQTLLHNCLGKLPIFIKVTRGSLDSPGDVDGDLVQEEEEIARVNSWVSQKRVIARDRQGTIFSFPLTFPVKFEVINQHNNGKKRKTLKSLLKKTKLPVTVRIDHGRKLKFQTNAAKMDMDVHGDLQIIKPYTEKFLICNAIKDGRLEKKVTLLPMYVDLRFHVGQGFKKGTPGNWEKFKRAYTIAASEIPYKNIQGTNAILLHSKNSNILQQIAAPQNTLHAEPGLGIVKQNPLVGALEEHENTDVVEVHHEESEEHHETRRKEDSLNIGEAQNFRESLNLRESRQDDLFTKQLETELNFGDTGPKEVTTQKTHTEQFHMRSTTEHTSSHTTTTMQETKVESSERQIVHGVRVTPLEIESRDRAENGRQQHQQASLTSSESTLVRASGSETEDVRMSDSRKSSSSNQAADYMDRVVVTNAPDTEVTGQSTANNRPVPAEAMTQSYDDLYANVTRDRHREEHHTTRHTATAVVMTSERHLLPAAPDERPQRLSASTGHLDRPVHISKVYAREDADTSHVTRPDAHGHGHGHGHSHGHGHGHQKIKRSHGRRRSTESRGSQGSQSRQYGTTFISKNQEAVDYGTMSHTGYDKVPTFYSMEDLALIQANNHYEGTRSHHHRERRGRSEVMVQGRPAHNSHTLPYASTSSVGSSGYDYEYDTMDSAQYPVHSAATLDSGERHKSNVYLPPLDEHGDPNNNNITVSKQGHLEAKLISQGQPRDNVQHVEVKQMTHEERRQTKIKMMSAEQKSGYGHVALYDYGGLHISLNDHDDHNVWSSPTPTISTNSMASQGKHHDVLHNEVPPHHANGDAVVSRDFRVSQHKKITAEHQNSLDDSGKPVYAGKVTIPIEMSKTGQVHQVETNVPVNFEMPRQSPVQHNGKRAPVQNFEEQRRGQVQNTRQGQQVQHTNVSRAPAQDYYDQDSEETDSEEYTSDEDEVDDMVQVSSHKANYAEPNRPYKTSVDVRADGYGNQYHSGGQGRKQHGMGKYPDERMVQPSHNQQNYNEPPRSHGGRGQQQVMRPASEEYSDEDESDSDDDDEYIGNGNEVFYTRDNDYYYHTTGSSSGLKQRYPTGSSQGQSRQGTMGGDWTASSSLVYKPKDKRYTQEQPEYNSRGRVLNVERGKRKNKDYRDYMPRDHSPPVQDTRGARKEQQQAAFMYDSGPSSMSSGSDDEGREAIQEDNVVQMARPQHRENQVHGGAPVAVKENLTRDKASGLRNERPRKDHPKRKSDQPQDSERRISVIEMTGDDQVKIAEVRRPSVEASPMTSDLQSPTSPRSPDTPMSPNTEMRQFFGNIISETKMEAIKEMDKFADHRIQEDSSTPQQRDPPVLVVPPPPPADFQDTPRKTSVTTQEETTKDGREVTVTTKMTAIKAIDIKPGTKMYKAAQPAGTDKASYDDFNAELQKKLISRSLSQDEPPPKQIESTREVIIGKRVESQPVKSTTSQYESKAAHTTKTKAQTSSKPEGTKVHKKHEVEIIRGHRTQPSNNPAAERHEQTRHDSSAAKVEVKAHSNEQATGVQLDAARESRAKDSTSASQPISSFRQALISGKTPPPQTKVFHAAPKQSSSTNKEVLSKKSEETVVSVTKSTKEQSETKLSSTDEPKMRDKTSHERRSHLPSFLRQSGEGPPLDSTLPGLEEAEHFPLDSLHDSMKELDDYLKEQDPDAMSQLSSVSSKHMEHFSFTMHEGKSGQITYF